ncbi:MAG TPA: carbonic anhydrase family protein, partial [Planctomycetota bacterium]|nr:carbonic anhydrase family protein [Planctomycetota bacterium]
SIVLGGSGNGEAIAANRVRGVRCALCWNEESARLARAHNDSNVLSLGERLLTAETALAIVDVWLATAFEGGRHARRLELIDAETADEGVPRLTKEARDAVSPDELVELAKAGNLRFRSGKRRRRDLLDELRRTAPGQYPAAVLLSCMDSRAPAEIVFDLGLGDVFNCRVAGNVENEDLLGSLEYATAVAGAKLVLVLGHSACGAIKGALEGARLGHLTGLLERLQPAIEATAFAGERSAASREFVDAVARRNVELTVASVRRRSPVIAELERRGALKVVGGFYDVSTGAVEFIA